MKRQLLVFFAMAILGISHAQQVSYKVVQNDPEKFHPKVSVNAVLAGIDVSFNNINSMNFYAAAFGHVLLQDKIGIQFYGQHSWLALGKMGNKDLPSPWEIDAGGFLFLNKRVRPKTLNIVLKRKNATVNNKQVEVVSSLPVKGNVIKYNGIRGGLYSKASAFDLNDNVYFEGLGMSDASMNNTGFYAGLLSRRLSNMVIDAEGFGKRFHSLGFDLYVDAAVQFSNKFTLRETPSAVFNAGKVSGDDITDDVKREFGNATMGFRVGVNGFQIAPKSVTDKKFGMCYNFEGGYLPYTGFYVKGGIGLTLVKK